MGKISLFILEPVIAYQNMESTNIFTALYSHKLKKEEFLHFLITPFKFVKLKEFHHKYSGIRQIFIGIDQSKFITINENNEMVAW